MWELNFYRYAPVRSSRSETIHKENVLAHVGASVSFPIKALVQRCQWHKRENVVRDLPKTQQAAYDLAQDEKKVGRLKVLTGIILIPNLATFWMTGQKSAALMPPAPLPVTLTGWLALLSHPIPFLLLLAFVAYMNRVQLSPEEYRLPSKFGDEWETYKQAIVTQLT